jgi:hypothetical protein
MKKRKKKEKRRKRVRKSQTKKEKEYEKCAPLSRPAQERYFQPPPCLNYNLKRKEKRKAAVWV